MRRNTKRKTRGWTAFLLSGALLLAGAVPAFGTGDLDYSQWDSLGIYPDDVINTKYFTAVKAMQDRKVVTGDTDGLFHPEKTISRAEFSVMMAKAAAIGKNVNMDQYKGKQAFSDMKGYEWAAPYINYLAEQGMVKGISEHSFAPYAPVTYVQLIAMVLRTQNAGAGVEQYGSWPDNYIHYAQLYNMTGGMVAVRDWNRPATKGDVALLMYRNMGILKPSR